jgi:cyclic beta-1,2-glucan glucanotransferase
MSAVADGRGTPDRLGECRTKIESILGLRRQDAFLPLSPRIPKHRPGCEIAIPDAVARYDIVVENPHGVDRRIATAELDGDSHYLK